MAADVMLGALGRVHDVPVPCRMSWPQTLMIGLLDGTIGIIQCCLLD